MVIPKTKIKINDYLKFFFLYLLNEKVSKMLSNYLHMSLSIDIVNAYNY
jgi:hypothetical protein